MILVSLIAIISKNVLAQLKRCWRSSKFLLRKYTRTLNIYLQQFIFVRYFSIMHFLNVILFEWRNFPRVITSSRGRGRLDDSVGVPTGGEGSWNVVNKYAFQLYILHFWRFYGNKKRKIKMIKVMNVSLKLHLNS